jgi:hypothetical protein
MLAGTSRPPTPAPGSPAAPTRLFYQKFDSLNRALAFRAEHRGVRGQDFEDLLQNGALVLLQQYRRAADPAIPAFVIDSTLLATAAYDLWIRTRPRWLLLDDLRLRKHQDVEPCIEPVGRDAKS